MNFIGVVRDLVTIKELSLAGRHQECLQACQTALQVNPQELFAYKYAGKSLLALGQFEKAQHCLAKAHQLDGSDPEILKDIGNIFNALKNDTEAIKLYKASLSINQNYAPAINNLGLIARRQGDLIAAEKLVKKARDLDQSFSSYHTNLVDIYLELADYKNAENAVDLAIDMNTAKLDICKRLKAACLFQKQEYDEAIELLKSLKAETIYTEQSSLLTEACLRSCIYAKKYKSLNLQLPKATVGQCQGEERKYLVIKRSRPVENNLIEELLKVESKDLVQAKDARNGDGCCTNFELFSSNSPAIKKLSKDLSAIASEALSKDVPPLKYDSFFNIFKSGAGTTPHRHLTPDDKNFNLWQNKYSLVYYLDPGDRDCKNPGILKMYDPDIQILPDEGMIVIIPANRMHSSFYDGSKSRLMVGVNFYAFPRA